MRQFQEGNEQFQQELAVIGQTLSLAMEDFQRCSAEDPSLSIG